MRNIRWIDLKSQHASDHWNDCSVDTKAVDRGLLVVVFLGDICSLLEQILGNRKVAKEHRSVEWSVPVWVCDARIATSLDQEPSAFEVALDGRPTQCGGLKFRMKLGPLESLIKVDLSRQRLMLADSGPDVFFRWFILDHCSAPLHSISDGSKHHQVAKWNQGDRTDEARQKDPDEPMSYKSFRASLFPKLRREKAASDEKHGH